MAKEVGSGQKLQAVSNRQLPNNFREKKTNQRGAWHITEKMLMHSKWIFMYVAGRGLPCALLH